MTRSNEKRHVDSFLLVERRDKSNDFYTSRVIFNQLTWCVCFVGARVCGCVSETVNLKVPAGRGIFFFSPFLTHFLTFTPPRELYVETALISLFWRSSRSSTARWSKVSPLCGFRLWWHFRIRAAVSRFRWWGCGEIPALKLKYPL